MPPKKKEKPVPEVSPAEWEVLESLWKHGSQAARDVYASLQTEKRWDIKTVRTLLSRLVEKGAIEYDQIGNSYLYRAAYRRDQLICGEVRNVANRVLDGSISALFAAFIQEEQLSDKEIRKMREILDTKLAKEDAR